MPVGEQLARYYPGLIPDEADLWRRWLHDHEGEWDRFEYNVRVGPGVEQVPTSLPPGSPLSDALAGMWKKLTQFKVDVVGYVGPEVWLFEVKVNPGHGALGQLQSYATLLIRERDLQLAPQLALVCDRVPPNMLPVYLENGVTVWELSRGELPGPGVLPPP